MARNPNLAQMQKLKAAAERLMGPETIDARAAVNSENTE
jgi:hypothetical protein